MTHYNDKKCYKLNPKQFRMRVIYGIITIFLGIWLINIWAHTITINILPASNYAIDLGIMSIIYMFCFRIIKNKLQRALFYKITLPKIDRAIEEFRSYQYDGHAIFFKEVNLEIWHSKYQSTYYKFYNIKSHIDDDDGCGAVYGVSTLLTEENVEIIKRFMDYYQNGYKIFIEHNNSLTPEHQAKLGNQFPDSDLLDRILNKSKYT